SNYPVFYMVLPGKMISRKRSHSAAPARRRSPRLIALAMLDRWREIELDWDEQLDSCSQADRALARQLVSGTLRMRGRIDYYLGFFLHRKLTSLPESVLNILRMALFQLKFCDRIPDYAILNESVELAKGVCGGNYTGLVNGVLRSLVRGCDKVSLPGAEDDPVGWLAVNFSYPEWMVGRYLERFGFGFTRDLLQASNTLAPLVLRERGVRAKADRQAERLKDILEKEGLTLKYGQFAPEALIVETDRGGLPRVSLLPGYSEGLFYVQDEAAMLVSRLAAPEKHGLILDSCAAPGGKTTHLADLAGREARIIACDLNRKRLEKLEANLDRLGLDNVTLIAADARRPAFKAVDLVLCDVPCTGTGVLRRKPELRWRINEKDLAGLTGLQREILSACAVAVRPGGVLVYSTCSLEHEENWGVVSDFLKEREDFCLERADSFIHKELVSSEGCLASFPNVHRIDGAFAARLKKKCR
ncbi:MAG: 16S rRNA (cytosine(967)-C(5))-methyltransferase RsmB, partial [Gemmatimonadota bacterium]|nr:16S rRNA (cytosine(967)-C(5))-methyltransferase RsmB [Gemmatimonadota bacterium]